MLRDGIYSLLAISDIMLLPISHSYNPYIVFSKESTDIVSSRFLTQ